LLYVANKVAPGVINSAALATSFAFAGLTAVVFLTREDFSFLRGILCHSPVRDRAVPACILHGARYCSADLIDDVGISWATPPQFGSWSRRNKAVLSPHFTSLIVQVPFPWVDRDARIRR